MVKGSIPLVGTIQVKLTNYFNTFQTEFFWSIAEIRQKTISEDFEVTSQVTVVVGSRMEPQLRRTDAAGSVGKSLPRERI